jgi:hypothetical protein
MTRANIEQQKYTPWFTKAGAACSIVPIARFVNDRIFALKGGGYVDGVRVMLILGPTGTGKSVHGNMAIAHEQKYGGFTYIFDIGGSYESVVELYGGRVDRIGKDGPRVNPFALEPTESNVTFLYSFVKLLLVNGGAELEPEDDDVIHKAVRDMYLLDVENRRLSNLFLPKKLDRYLSKWVGSGVYHAVFDNVEDSLSLSRLQCFDFQGVNNEQYADLIEPVMVWLLRRINDVLYNPANLGVPKHILIEEIFSSMKNKQLLDGALASIKTVRKNLGGVTMIGQSAEDLGANELLANNETEKGVALLSEQGRVTEIAGANERIAAIARDYAAQPENTIIVSPDNRSRRQINEAVRTELRRNGTLAENGHELSVLDHRSDMTGADRTWAARYNVDDVLHYNTGSKTEGIERNSYARVREVDARANMLTVELENGASITYDPRRLHGVNVFTEAVREFSTGDRIQFTESNKLLGIANRDLGTVVAMDNGQMTVRLDGKQPREITFDTAQFRQFDHGYAVTSHSSQGLTAGRVLANIDTESSRMLINTRLAYVAVSRASEDVRIYTNDAETLGQRLAADISKTAAVDFWPPSTTGQAREAVELFREHQPGTATERLQQQGRVYEYQSPDHRLAAVALDYTVQPDRTVVIAPDAAERRELTQLIRADLQKEGKLASENRTLPVLVEQKFPNPHFAGNYLPGDQIHFRTGSPALEGIPHNSVARVLEVDSRRNTLTIETTDGGQVTYNPAQLRNQTRQSTVYREETREMAVGERIRFTASEKNNHIRIGDFATVERIEPDLSVRLDNGKSADIDAEAALHIDYGYAVDTAANFAADRVILTGEAPQLARLEDDLARLNPSIRELSVYTSDASQALQVELAQSPAVAETLSKSLADTANLGVAESIVEEIGLHL